MMNTKRILITGASGFIGSFLVDKALSQGYEVWAGVRASSSRRYLQDSRIHFIDLHLENAEKLAIQLDDFIKQNGKFDYVIHNAGVTKCIDHKDFDRVNYDYTVHLIDALKTQANTPTKFILMSSLSAYGPGDEEGYTPISDQHTPQPNTVYGNSKLKAEIYLKAQEGFPYIIMRPTGVYGPRETDYFLMLKTIKSGLDVGAGFKPQHLTFIYVKDLADAVFLALESELSNRSYFVSDGDVYTDSQYTSLAQQCLGKKHVLRLKVPLCILWVISCLSESIAKLRGKPATLNRDKYKIMKQRNWECDTTPLQKELGFSANYNLQRGLSESIAWYKNRAGFSPNAPKYR